MAAQSAPTILSEDLDMIAVCRSQRFPEESKEVVTVKDNAQSAISDLDRGQGVTRTVVGARSGLGNVGTSVLVKVVQLVRMDRILLLREKSVYGEVYKAT